MNRIGKTLVLLHTAVSIVALSWAVGLFFQFTDWGWKEARLKEGRRIPSEYDKRTAAFKEGVKARDIALAGLVPRGPPGATPRTISPRTIFFTWRT